MTSRDFCYWLQGFFEVRNAGPKPQEPFDGKSLHGYQVELIEKHLAMVFRHEIDSTFGDKKKQDALTDIHGEGLMRC